MVLVKESRPRMESHSFFANDIVLFAEATSNVCDTVMGTVEEFYEMFGQTLSLSKSLLFVYPSVPRS